MIYAGDRFERIDWVNSLAAADYSFFVLQTSYIRRERQYQRQVEDLQNQLAVARRGGIEGLAGDTMEKIRQQHKQIMDDINGIHLRTANKIKGVFKFCPYLHCTIAF